MSTRQEQALALAEELLTDIELERIGAHAIVLKASRLARLAEHAGLAELTQYERDGYKGAPRQLIELTGRRAPDGERGDGSDDGFRYWPLTMGELASRELAVKEALTALRGGGSYSGDGAIVASRDHDAKIAAGSRDLQTTGKMKTAALAAVYTRVAEIYHELLFSELQATLFAAVQTSVDGSLAQASGSALAKIQSVSDRLRDGDPESISHAMSTCRRLIDAVADYTFPGQDEPYHLGDEQLSVKAGTSQLNRLQAAVHAAGVGKTRRDRLRQSLRNLYSLASAGTHADVTVEEARFVFLQTYITLGEVVAIASSPATNS